MLADKGSQELPAGIPEEGPDDAEGGDDLIGIDFFALPIVGGLSLTVLPFTTSRI
ncbi:hypothetical protein Holit_01044 [Hollandina sp. SP2]